MATQPERKAKSKMSSEDKHQEYLERMAEDRHATVENMSRGLYTFVHKCGGPNAYHWELTRDKVVFEGENIVVEEGKPEQGKFSKQSFPTVVITFYVNGCSLELPQCPEGAADTIERYLNQ